MTAEERATDIVQKWMRTLSADVPVRHDQGVVLRNAIAEALSAESEREKAVAELIEAGTKLMQAYKNGEDIHYREFHKISNLRAALSRIREVKG